MRNYHLNYAISKRTSPSPKTMKAITDAQEAMNRRCTWTHERLALAPLVDPERAPFAFPFVRLGSPKPFGALRHEIESDAAPAVRIADASAYGSTKVRDNLWNAHLVVAFLRSVSAAHPELVLELRDEGGFVLPGAVWIRAGKVELQHDWLNRERARVLEMTGDPQAAAPYIWAEAEALQGHFFEPAAASDFIEVPEVQGLDASWEQLRTMTVEDLAETVVDHVTAQVPVVAA